ncbi:uncharacterized protein LOC131613893 [Vicia villosa]|uniref:uncharacterized protein LOC131613893 n=1 Tax=Vicia villosa TaxID=3911 RepID=UPI00273B1B2E|nr:uncharacterized protein LOC131613893 [Vicia villosa]
MDRLKGIGDRGSNSISSEESISTGEFFPCLSTADSDIVRCNNRMSSKSEVGLKVWISIVNLGLESHKKGFVNERLINDMEMRDKEETKLATFNEDIAGAFWGNKDVEWTTSNSIGAAGRMVILWRKGALSVNYSFVDKGYVGININWKGAEYNLVNVYVACNRADRLLLWESLLSKKRSRGHEEWCVVGDFNEVLRKEERIGEGGNQFTRGMEEFRSFVEQMDLVDINCVGGKFTWFKDNGKAMSRLDRFLLSKKFVEEWEGFKSFVELEWKKLIVKGRGDFVLYEKLKRLRERLRVWNREVFGWIELKLEDASEKINVFDKVIGENMGGNKEVVVNDIRTATKDLWNCLNVKESMLRLKSRNLWLKDGDKNSRFFHNSIKERHRCNVITSLEGSTGRVEGVENIKEEVKRYFLEFFKEEDSARLVMDGLDFNSLEAGDASCLERKFSE